MGTSESKPDNHGNDRQPDMLMKKNAKVAKKFARRPGGNKSQHEESVEQMAKDLAALAQRKNNGPSGPNDGKQIEIDGVTYQITQFVNRGGFGEIYKAQAGNSKRTVAIKIMQNSPGIQEEIKNEISFLRLTKTITLENHPVIEYFGCKFSKEGIFIAMELAACDLLTFWFNHVAEKEAEEKFIFGIIIIVYVLRALIFLEKLNIIHGDIKPQNLVIVQGGNQCFYVKLIDFGTVEKMNTCRAQLTVDATKAHTLFFASPEFLRRDANNMMSRHLDKKSDAWAAGVMFYILFFEKLPWTDQFDYENFCNNPRAKDVVVPHEGGYKLIIELLLKKNPRDRSSAKATFMQMKAHPVLGTIVQSLQENFCPIDDVCNLNVPDNARRELAKLARPGHVANRSASPFSRTSSGSRRSCRYGRDCFRRDEDHRDEFAHPGDPDYHVASEKTRCRYGADCFRTDADHRQKYAHPGGSDRHATGGTGHNHSSKEECRYGTRCYKTDIDHRTQYSHPGDSNGRSKKEKCRFGDGCNKIHDREHMTKYLHD